MAIFLKVWLKKASTSPLDAVCVILKASLFDRVLPFQEAENN